METHEINISFVLSVNGHIAIRDFTIDWIASDDVDTIATDIKDAILNIE